MTTSINEYYENAQLAMASYAILEKEISDEDLSDQGAGSLERILKV